MDILADESLDEPVVAWLRELRHNVLFMAESAPSTKDRAVIELARAEQRVLITQDRHFGELVFRHKLRPAGVVFLRLRARSSSQLLKLFQRFWPEIEVRAIGNFIVVTRRKIRVRPL